MRKLIESKTNISVASIKTKTSYDTNQDMLHSFCELHQRSTDVCQQGLNTKTSDLLKQCARVDRVIKGRAYGEPWQELLQLSIAIRYSI